MERNKFLLRLAVENKVAVVSENLINIVQLTEIPNFPPVEDVLSPNSDNRNDHVTHVPKLVSGMKLCEDKSTILSSSSDIKSKVIQVTDPNILSPNPPQKQWDSNVKPQLCTTSNSISDPYSFSEDEDPLIPSRIPKLHRSETLNPYSSSKLAINQTTSLENSECRSSNFTVFNTEPDVRQDEASSNQSVLKTSACVQSKYDLVENQYHSLAQVKSQENTDMENTELKDRTYLELNASDEKCSTCTSIISNSVSDIEDSFLDLNSDTENPGKDFYCENSEGEYMPSEVSSADSYLSTNISTQPIIKYTLANELGKTFKENSDLPLCEKRYNTAFLDINSSTKTVNGQPVTSQEVALKRDCEKVSKIFSSNPAVAQSAIEDKDFISQQTLNTERNQHYIKKVSARERPTICPICFKDVATHFTRHLFRHHKNDKNVKAIKNLNPKCKERLSMIAMLRRQGYFHLKMEKNILNPVKSSKNPQTKYFICAYCLGYFTQKLLYKHVKICKNKPTNIANPGTHCLANSQTFVAAISSKNYEFLRTSRLKEEVFSIMRADDISAIAKSDSLICLYGETLLGKHKRQQVATLISNKIREMARLLKILRTTDRNLSCLFDALRPNMFGSLLTAVRIICGYNEAQKSFVAPSLALHMGTNLKIVCDVAFKLVVENRVVPNIKFENKEQKKSEIKDLKKLIAGHWCNEIASLALKTLKERKWEKPVQLPLTSDVLAFQELVNKLGDNAFVRLTSQIDLRQSYKTLTECVLAQTIMFNRKRVGDVQYLTIDTYNKDNHQTDHDTFTDSLTEVEKMISKQFKRVITGGKGSKPIPILFSRRTQKFIACLLKIRVRTNIVPKANPYLFANPGSENKWMDATSVIRRLAQKCGAKQPELLTSTKFRKHIATTLQIMSMEPHEMEQIATFMGHTKKTHEEFYRLPQDIFQTAKVAKVLLLLEKGQGKKFHGKNLNEIEFDGDIYYSSESDEDGEEETQSGSQAFLRRAANTFQTGKVETDNQSVDEEVTLNEKYTQRGKAKICGKAQECDQEIHYERHEMQSGETQTNLMIDHSETSETRQLKQPDSTKISGRVKWTNEEKKVVLSYFKRHLKQKITPKKHECDQFLEKYGNNLKNKDWIKIKTFVYNSFRG